MTKYKSTPPSGFEKLKPTFDAYEVELKNITTKNINGSAGSNRNNIKSINNRDVWEIYKVTHKRSRYIFDLFYRRKLISKDLYTWCLKEGLGDKNLIAKWKKKGYEKLCCLQCIQTVETNAGNKTCICRVPRATLLKQQQARTDKTTNEKTAESHDQEETTNSPPDKDISKVKIAFKQCQNCGCSGCASTD